MMKIKVIGLCLLVALLGGCQGGGRTHYYHTPYLACCKNSYYNEGASSQRACDYHRCYNVGCCGSIWR